MFNLKLVLAEIIFTYHFYVPIDGFLSFNTFMHGTRMFSTIFNIFTFPIVFPMFFQVLCSVPAVLFFDYQPEYE